MKRTFAILLIVFQLFTLSVFAGSDKETHSFDSELTEKVSAFISTLSSDPAGYGLDGIDFENLQVGKGINPYFLGDSAELQKDESTAYYPLLSKNKVVGIFTVMRSDDGGVCITYGEDFSKELNRIIKNDKTNALMLIYDNEELKAATSKSITKVRNRIAGTDKIERKPQIDISLIVPDATKMTSVEPNVNVTLNSLSTQAITAYATSSYKALSVPKRQQSYTNSCWAACVGAIGQFKTGIYKSDYQIYNAISYPVGNPGAWQQKQAAFTKIYGLGSTPVNTLPLQTIINKIDASKPIITTFERGSTGSYHDVVIRGYNSTSSGFIALTMNPGNAAYELAYESSGNLYFDGNGSRWFSKQFLSLN